MKLVLSRAAENDIIDIADYIAKDNPERAVSFIDEIRTHLKTLLHFPDKGALRNDVRDDLRSLIFRKYIIFYAVKQNALIITRILHGARDIDSVFEDENN